MTGSDSAQQVAKSATERAEAEPVIMRNLITPRRQPKSSPHGRETRACAAYHATPASYRCLCVYRRYIRRTQSEMAVTLLARLA